MGRIPESTHFREEKRAVWCHKPVTKAPPGPTSCPRKWPQFTLEGSSGKRPWGCVDLRGLWTSVPLGLGAEALGRRAAPAGSSLGKPHQGSTLPENLPRRPAICLCTSACTFLSKTKHTRAFRFPGASLPPSTSTAVAEIAALTPWVRGTRRTDAPPPAPWKPAPGLRAQRPHR